MQKGIDLIADVMPAVLEANEHVQLICVGPVIDLYGRFAALKLDVMMNKYPGRVFSKPEFTALPPFIFSGAEFALIPSRDEPFGLVAVEFGRKGALGIGARVGGLGQMPGWWFTVESTTTSHMHHQFKTAIKSALASKLETRQIMRARSAKQRFPVDQWITELEKLQSTSIHIHDREASKALGRPKSSRHLSTMSGFSTPKFPGTRASSIMDVAPGEAVQLSTLKPIRHSGDSRPSSRGLPDGSEGRGGSLSPGPYNKGHQSGFMLAPPGDNDSEYGDSISDITPGTRRGSTHIHEDYLGHDNASLDSPMFPPDMGIRTPGSPGTPGSIRSPSQSDYFLEPPRPGFGDFKRPSSTLSLSTIVGDKKDFNLQKVDPDFTDSKGAYYKAFEEKLQKLSAGNSEDTLCIEEYLVKSERQWYGQFKAAKLGHFSSASTQKLGTFANMSTTSLGFGSRSRSRASSVGSASRSGDGPPAMTEAEMNQLNADEKDQWLLGDDYKPPTGIRLFMQLRLGDWPVYSLFLAFGQIVAANAYQITLLTGTVGQTAAKLYSTSSIYLATTVIWWIMFRKLKSVYVLSVPFIFYALAFALLGLAPVVHTTSSGRNWMQNVATAMYATGSSSGSIFFALNFGDEGGSPVKSWVFRSCVIQGTQQIYVCALWAWGNYITSLQTEGISNGYVINTASYTMAYIALPIAALFIFVGLMLYLGLPNYYRQQPGEVPSFYHSVFRRKIIVWFFVVVIIQNYFMSSSTGRNWQYLWKTDYAKTWHIALLVILFFIVIWSIVLWIFGILSKDHSWILPVFAIGLGAPRWGQILWSCTTVGIYLPWAPSHLASALLGRSLWLWLGLLDALQGVGFGMVLLQTLTRIHIAFTLCAAQVLGSIATMVARATAPNRLGPGDLFPDFSDGPYPGITRAWFWIGLICQLIVCAGFFRFFRKEQLSKP